MKSIRSILREHCLTEAGPPKPKSRPRKVIAYHGGPKPIRKFDPKMGAQGVMWFSEDKDKILSGESGASSTKWIMTVELRVDKTAGWDLYDKRGLGEIYQMGYDSINLDHNWVIFDADRVKVTHVEKNY